MESQNHYYGHSAALARHCGFSKAHHIRGLVQHGWTGQSPVETHFRDFPELRHPQGPRSPRLFVWSHDSRAWRPAEADAVTTPIGAQFLYRVADRPAIEPTRGTVFLPVHGIQTQALTGDHRGAARELLDLEGPSTVCIYWADLKRPGLVDAYAEAGHRCVTLGTRNEPEFLDRLVSLLSSHRRVVSNRLSTPVVYAASIGRDVAVYGDPMRIDGEDRAEVDMTAALWPEFYDRVTHPEVVQKIARDELGSRWLREPAELRELLGWDERWRPRPLLDYWVMSPWRRALVNVRRKSSAPAPASEGAGISLKWLIGALSYLPRPIGQVNPGKLDPIPVR